MPTTTRVPSATVLGITGDAVWVEVSVAPAENVEVWELRTCEFVALPATASDCQASDRPPTAGS